MRPAQAAGDPERLSEGGERAPAGAAPGSPPTPGSYWGDGLEVHPGLCSTSAGLRDHPFLGLTPHSLMFTSLIKPPRGILEASAGGQRPGHPSHQMQGTATWGEGREAAGRGEGG